ncbi:MAG: hypothetical protein ACI9R3_001310 [Verrucomicrobiales bacterium]|jgi:hypothetical protein
MTKSSVVSAVCAQVEQDLQRTIAAARAVEAAATDPESRSEGKYDTRGLEASYLAAGQSAQVEALASSLRLLQLASSFPDFQPHQRIGAGALVEVEIAGNRDFFLLAPAAGGLMVEAYGNEVTILAPGAPLRIKLEGGKVGDQLDAPRMQIVALQ